MWRRARATQARPFQQPEVSDAPQETFALSPFEWSFDGDDGRVDGNGYAFLNRDGQPFFALDSENHRVERLDGVVTQVAGVSHYAHLQAACFEPGEMVALVTEPHNQYDANAVGVWDARCKKQLGHLPRHVASEVAVAIAQGQNRDAMVLWEWRKGNKRIGVRILIAPGINRNF